MLGNLGGLKLSILVGALSTVVAATGGFVAGKKWEQSKQVVLMREQIEAANVAYTESLERLNAAWQQEAARVELELAQWLEQHETDQAIITNLVNNQEQIRSNFDVLNNLVKSHKTGGTCSFSAADISLFNNASFAANHNRSGS